jgi:hypothetical protein
VIHNAKQVRVIAEAVDQLSPQPPGGCIEGYYPPGIKFAFFGPSGGAPLAVMEGSSDSGFPDAYCLPTQFRAGHGDQQLLVNDYDLLQRVGHVIRRNLVN